MYEEVKELPEKRSLLPPLYEYPFSGKTTPMASVLLSLLAIWSCMECKHCIDVLYSHSSTSFVQRGERRF